MTAHVSPPVAASAPPSVWRRFVAAVRTTMLRITAIFQTISRRRRVKREHRKGEVVASEILISYPNLGWDPLTAVTAKHIADPVDRTPNRWGVERATELLDAEHGDELAHVRRRFVRVSCKQGYEREVIRTVKLASWREGMPVGQGGLLAVRSAVVVPASLGVPAGAVTFSQHYTNMKAHCVGTVDSAVPSVKVLIVDVDVPDPAVLALLGVRLETVTGTAPIGGHATMVAAIVGDIAKNAKIHAVGIGTAGGTASAWGLMNAIEHHGDADVVIACLAFADGGGTWEEDERSEFVDGYLRRVTGGNVNLPLLVFPTGNHDHQSNHECNIGVPGRSEAAITIGAVDPSGARAVGSRYGRKSGADPERWWVAPGGSFGGLQKSVPLLRVADEEQYGTSVAAAFGGGVICVALGLQRSASPAGDNAANVYGRALLDRSPTDPAVPVLRQLAAEAAGQASPTVLLRKLEQMADTKSIQMFSGSIHGKGLIRITDAITATIDV